MAVHLIARLVRETDVEVEYVFGSSPEELATSPGTVVLPKATREATEEWDLRVWPPERESSGARVVAALVRHHRRTGDPRWPRTVQYSA